MKRILSLFLAAIISMLLAGCIATPKTPGNDTDTVSQSKINKDNSFLANIVEINFDSSTAIVEPLENEKMLASSDRISVNLTNLEYIYPVVGDTVRIEYSGDIRETYPAQIDVTNWEISNDLRDYEYTDVWLDKRSAAKSSDDEHMDDLTVTKIYKNCFFATNVYPDKYVFKINGVLPEDICVNDEIYVYQKNIYTDEKAARIESDLINIQIPPFVHGDDPLVCYKPVIYLYPEKVTDINVRLDLNGKLSCAYPLYNNGWNVKAQPDGTLKDANGLEYNYLYWEGEINTDFDFSQGFCIKGEDTTRFLESALKKLGLNRREANEFIIYWLPQMQNNKYNLISFQSKAYTDNAKLDISPAPDTLIRVFMAYKPLESSVDIKPQGLTHPERTGFTVVEWGGSAA